MRFCTILLCLAATIAPAQEWVRTMDGAHGADEATALSVDSTRAVWITGRTARVSHSAVGTGVLDAGGQTVWFRTFDPYPGFDQVGVAIAVDDFRNALVGARSRDSAAIWCFALAKYSALGELQWNARYSHSARICDIPSGLVVADKGRCVVTGSSSKSTADKDLATVSYDAEGHLEWTARFDGPAGTLDESSAIVADPSGAVFVCGYVTVGTKTCAATLKYDSGGSRLMTTTLVFPGENSKAYDIVLDSAGHPFVAGYVGATYTTMLTFGSTPAGDTLWTRRFSNYGSTAQALAVDPAGNVFVTGTDYRFGNETPDIVTLAYDRDGNALWEARYDGEDRLEDWGRDVALGLDGSVYVCGSSQSAARGKEAVLIKYSGSGDTVWTARLAGDNAGGAVANAVEVDSDGNIVVAGSIHVEGNGMDYLVAKYPPTGPGISESPIEIARRGAVSVAPSVARSTCLLTGNACSDGYRFLISDVNGRVVRRLSASQPHGVSIQAGWNLDDDSGHLVPNGVYFVTLDSLAQSACAKIVVQR